MTVAPSVSTTTTGRTSSRRLVDFIDPAVADKFSSSLDPRARAALYTPIPDDVPDSDVHLVARAVQQRLPDMTGVGQLVQRVRAGQAGTLPQAPTLGPEFGHAEIAQRDFGNQPWPVRVGRQALAGASETLPGFGGAAIDANAVAPQPTSRGERLARAAGGVVAFGGESIPVTAALTPFLGPAAPAVAGGLVSAASPGSARERLVRGAVMTGLGGAASAVEGAAGGAIGRLGAAQALRSGAGVGAARGALRAAERVGGAAVGVPTAAAAFGGVAPHLEAAGERALGENVQQPTAEQTGQSIGDMAIIAGLAAAAHGAGGARARGASPVVENPAQPAPVPAGDVAAQRLPVRPPMAEPRAPRPGATPNPAAPPAPAVEPPAAPAPKASDLKVLSGTASNDAKKVNGIARALSQQYPDIEFHTRQMRNGAWMVAVPKDDLDRINRGEAAPPKKPEPKAPAAVQPVGKQVNASQPEAPVQRAPEAASEQAAVTTDAAPEVPATVPRGTPELTAEPKPAGEQVEAKPPVLKPLEQAALDMGPREIPSTPAGKPATQQGADAVAAMGGESRTFEDHFDELVKKGSSAEEARAEAEKLSGQTAPRGFDAEARASSTLHRAAEDAGQGSLFGAPESSGAGGSGTPSAGEPAKPGAPEPPRERERAPRKTHEEHVAERAAQARKANEPANRERLQRASWARLNASNDFQAEPTPHNRAKLESANAEANAAHEALHGTPRENPWEIGAGDQGTRGAEAQGTAAEIPAPISGNVAPEQASRQPEVVAAPSDPESEPSAKATNATVRAQSLHFHEGFQQRETGESSLVDPGRVQAYLQRHEGYSAEEMAKHPITVWKDAEGKLGPAGRTYVIDGHHRSYLAQRTWVKNDAGQYVESSVSDRELPAVEIHGPYEHALEQSRVANLATAPNTMVEKAKIARALTDQGKPLQQVAAHVTGGKQAQARDLISLSNLDPTLQREYFGDRGLPLNVGAFLGDFAKRYKVHPEHQRAWLTRLADGRIRSLDELRDSLDGYVQVLAAANQTSLLGQMDMGPAAITPSMAFDFIGKALTNAGSEERSARRAAKSTEQILEKGGSREELAAAKVLLERHQRDLARAKRVRDEAQRRTMQAVKEAYESGGSLADALNHVREWIETQVKWSPDEAGATSMFSDAAEKASDAGRWVSREVRRGISRARRRLWDAAPRDATHISVRDSGANGRIRDQIDLTERADDPYSQDAIVRFLTNARLFGGQDILPPTQLREFRKAMQGHAAWEDFFREHITDALGSNEAVRYFAEYGSGSEEMSKALHEQPNAIPAQFREAPGRIAALYDMAHEIAVEHAKRMGQKEPAKRADYGHPHIVDSVDRSEPLSRVLELIEGRKGREIGDAEMGERHNRFFDRRSGAEDYSRDAMRATRVYFNELARKLAYDPFLRSMQDYFEAPETLARDRQRADLARDFLRFSLFRQKNRFESLADEGVRAILFRNAGERAYELTPALAAKHLGIDPASLKAQGVKAVSFAPRGVEVRQRPDLKLLGQTAEGAYYAHDPDAALTTQNEPKVRDAVRSAVSANTDKWRRLTGRLRDPEENLRHQRKVDDAIRRLYRDPTALTQSLLTGSTSRAVLGWNARAAHINSGGTIITTLPEYGVAYAQGLAGATRAYARRAARSSMVGVTRMLERRGYLEPGTAEVARKALPLLRSEVYAEAAGVHQGEARQAMQRLRDVAEGRSETIRKMLDAAGPYAMFGAAEGWNRTVDILTADAIARRSTAWGGKGRVQRTAETFESLAHARAAFSQSFNDPRSAEVYATNSTQRTQFDYSELGTPLWALQTGAFGRVLFQLGRWPLYYAREYAYRPTAGALRVVGAAARGGVDAATGGRLGEAVPNPRGTIYRAGDAPNNWFERWMEYNGAHADDRHAAAVFMRQMGVAAALLGTAQATGLNVAAYGTPPQAVFALWVMRQFFPDDDTIAEWYKTAANTQALDITRGARPMGPTLTLVGDLATETAKRGMAAGKNPPDSAAAYFPWDATLEIARRMLLPGEVELKRFVQENPEQFESVPWIFTALGVKKAMEGATTGEKVRHQLGLQTPREQGETMRKVQP